MATQLPLLIMTATSSSRRIFRLISQYSTSQITLIMPRLSCLPIGFWTLIKHLNDWMKGWFPFIRLLSQNTRHNGSSSVRHASIQRSLSSWKHPFVSMHDSRQIIGPQIAWHTLLADTSETITLQYALYMLLMMMMNVYPNRSNRSSRTAVMRFGLPSSCHVRLESWSLMCDCIEWDWSCNASYDSNTLCQARNDFSQTWLRYVWL